MRAFCRRPLAAALLALTYLSLGLAAYAQTGNSTSITGVVLDPSGAVVPNATVIIQNPVSGFVRSTTTDGAGKFAVFNVRSARKGSLTMRRTWKSDRRSRCA
jgi:hypothetical protein